MNRVVQVKEPLMVAAAAASAIGLSMLLVSRQNFEPVKAQTGKAAPVAADKQSEPSQGARLKRRPSWEVKFEGPEPIERPAGLTEGADLLRDMSAAGQKELPP